MLSGISPTTVVRILTTKMALIVVGCNKIFFILAYKSGYVGFCQDAPVVYLLLIIKVGSSGDPIAGSRLVVASILFLLLLVSLF